MVWWHFTVNSLWVTSLWLWVPLCPWLTTPPSEQTSLCRDVHPFLEWLVLTHLRILKTGFAAPLRKFVLWWHPPVRTVDLHSSTSQLNHPAYSQSPWSPSLAAASGVLPGWPQWSNEWTQQLEMIMNRLPDEMPSLFHDQTCHIWPIVCVFKPWLILPLKRVPVRFLRQGLLAVGVRHR